MIITIFKLFKLITFMCLVAQSCLILCDPMDYSLGKNTGVGCHALLQGIFPTQGLNPGLPHRRWILYRLSHQGSPITFIVFSKFLCLFKKFNALSQYKYILIM